MLNLVVFICGAVVMVLEMVGSRILAPYLGTSIVVWTALIGVILGCLSLGYWWGGRLADRRASLSLLSNVIFLAALFTGAIALSKALILPYLQRTAGSIQLGAVLATVVLFAPPGVLLGMVSPLAVKLALRGEATAGRTVGALYALSTVGSILGTFLAGFVLIAAVGSTNILLLLAMVLGLTALLARFEKPVMRVGVVLALGLFWHAATTYDDYVAAQGILDVDTPYNRILIQPGIDVKSGREVRTISTSPRFIQSAMFVDDPADLVLDYTRYYKLAAHFRPGMKRLLVIGGAGYSFPKYALAAFPDLQVDVVELDPGITELARTHFALRDDPRLRIFHEDARTFLNRRPGTYDVILCDAFSSIYSVPFHLTTVQTVRALSQCLTPGGVVLLNLVSSFQGATGRFFQAELATYREVFPQVQALAIDNPAQESTVQNIILAALNTPEPAALDSPDPELAGFLARRWQGRADPQARVLTDDFAPVDYYMALVELGEM